MKINDWLTSLADHATPGIEECIEMLGNTFPLLYEFEETEQDPEWHAEGNVYIHTGMVLKELYSLLRHEASHITGLNRQALILSALLHDIAKPLTTHRKEVRGSERIVATQHETKGRSYLAPRLMELPLDYAVIDHVMGLVGEHQMPKLLVLKNQGRHQYLSLSRKAPMELLYWLEIADMKGRLCPDKDMQLDLLDQFRMFSEEYGVWEFSSAIASIKEEISPYLDEHSSLTTEGIFSSTLRDMEKGYITSIEEGLARSYHFRENFSDLIVLCGPSGSGKSSWIKKYAPEHEIISLDNIRRELSGKREDQSINGKIVHIAKDRLKAYLRKQQNIIWDSTNLREDFRQKICSTGFDYGALVTLVVFHKSEQMLRKDNRNRPYPVPEQVLTKQLTQWQWPTPDEAHRFWVVSGEGQLLKEAGGFRDGGMYHGVC